MQYSRTIAVDAETASPEKLRVAAVVYNPIKVDLASLRVVIDAEEAAAGWGETLWFETSIDDPGQGAAGAALAQNVSMIVVAGGDGTVRAVAEAVHEHDVAVALLGPAPATFWLAI